MKSEVAKTDVKYLSNGIQLAANLYIPANYKSGKLPAIVVSHPGSAVKEQAAGLYARHLAEMGFITLAFDCAFHGESGGEPRGLEDPSQRVEDIKASVSYLSTRSEVDSDRIGLLGICASGGYAAPATVSDHRIKAVATVSAADIGAQFRNGADGKQEPKVIQGLLDSAAKARQVELQGKGVQTFTIFPKTEVEARALGQHTYEGWEYYCTKRAEHPRGTKDYVWLSIERVAVFDAFKFIDMIAPRPLLMIAGTNANTQWMSKEGFERAKGDKELFWIDGASHVDLYDKPQYVGPAAEKLNIFFKSKLA
jgi:fermentation-respiration switch protein FrsA (DUF1100 family)